MIVAGVVSVTIVVPEYPASLPLLVSYISTLVNAEVGVVLGGLVIDETLNEKAVLAANVPPEKVNAAVRVLPLTEQDTDPTLETEAHVTELGTVISLGKVKTILSVES